MDSRETVARFLLERRLITPAQASAARPGTGFCAALVSAGVVDGDDLALAIARQNGADALEADGIPLAPELLRLIPESPSAPPAVLPLLRVNGILFAAANSGAASAVAAVEERMGLRIETIPVAEIDVAGVLVKAQQLLRRRAGPEPAAPPTLSSELDAPGLSDLGLSDGLIRRLRSAFQEAQGLFLIAGPPGAGTRETLDAVLEDLRQGGGRTARVEGARGAGAFEEALAGNPDALGVDGLEGAAMAILAVRAAVTQCDIVATIDAEDATSAVRRLADLKPDLALLAAGLRGVLSQRRLRRICAACAAEAPADPALLEDLRLERALRDVPLRRGRGCPACGQEGYRGSLGVFEFAEPEAAKAGRLPRLRPAPPTLGADALDKVRKGLTSLAEVAERVPYLQLLRAGDRS